MSVVGFFALIIEYTDGGPLLMQYYRERSSLSYVGSDVAIHETDVPEGHISSCPLVFSWWFQTIIKFSSGAERRRKLSRVYIQSLHLS